MQINDLNKNVFQLDEHRVSIPTSTPFEFTPEFAFVSTGGKKMMYTLRLYGNKTFKGVSTKCTQYVVNLSIDKETAIEKGRTIAKEMSILFNDEVDFDLNEIQRELERKEKEEHEKESQYNEEEDSKVNSLWERLKDKNPSEMEGQDLAIFNILKGESVFVSGPGGVGKSWVINQVKTSKTLLCAPSGIAAVNIGGVTCHSLFGLPIGIATQKEFNKPLPKDTQEIIGDVDRIIIDEVSMLRCDMFTLMESKLRKHFKNDLPWGGMQVVVVGDFYQLPPIISSTEKQHYYNLYEDKQFAFESDVWNFKTIELTKVYRQDDERQVRMLGHVRRGTERALQALQAIQKESLPYMKGNDSLALCAVNKDAEAINRYWSDLLPSKWRKVYSGITEGWDNSISYKIVKDKIELKVGTKVVLCANDPQGYYKNGERGTVVYLKPSYILVEKDNGEKVVVERYTWNQTKYVKNGNKIEQEVVGSFSQLPIKEGWAISIHKSQGITIPEGIIDVGERGCFENGQLYVALSRIKDLKKVSFKRPVQRNSLKTNDKVKQFYEHN